MIKLTQDIKDIATERLDRDVEVAIESNNIEITVETQLGEIQSSTTYDQSLLDQAEDSPRIRRFVAENAVGKLQAKLITSIL